MMSLVGVNVVLGLFVFLGGLVLLLSNWGHVLVSLLSLEFLVLSFCLMFGLEVMCSEDSFGVLFFIAFAVCEGCLGLSVLVMYVFMKGSDSMSLSIYLRW